MILINRLKNAQSLYNRNQFAEAVQVLADELGENPHCAPAHLLMALSQSNLKQDALAKHYAEKAVELASKDSQTHFTLSLVLVPLFEQEYVIKYNAEGRKLVCRTIASAASVQSLQAIRNAIDLDPKNPGFYTQLAFLNLVFTHWEEAFEAAEKGLELDPMNAICRCYRASALLDMGELTKADHAITALLALNPDSPFSHAALGELCLCRRQPKEAEKHFREALRLQPCFLWAERGLRAVGYVDTDHMFVREMVGFRKDPLFNDPYRAIRWLTFISKIFVVTVFVLLIVQAVSATFWPQKTFFHAIGHFLLGLGQR